MTAVMERPQIASYDLELFARRLVADCLNNALASQWRRRADAFDWCRPRSTDYRGRATTEQLADDDERCRSVSIACRRHADAIESGWMT